MDIQTVAPPGAPARVAPRPSAQSAARRRSTATPGSTGPPSTVTDASCTANVTSGRWYPATVTARDTLSRNGSEAGSSEGGGTAPSGTPSAAQTASTCPCANQSVRPTRTHPAAYTHLTLPTLYSV